MPTRYFTINTSKSQTFFFYHRTFGFNDLLLWPEKMSYAAWQNSLKSLKHLLSSSKKKKNKRLRGRCRKRWKGHAHKDEIIKRKNKRLRARCRKRWKRQAHKNEMINTQLESVTNSLKCSQTKVLDSNSFNFSTDLERTLGIAPTTEQANTEKPTLELITMLKHFLERRHFLNLLRTPFLIHEIQI